MLEQLPLTLNGKVDRNQLPPPDWEQMSEREYVAPRTPVEQALAEMFAQVLGVERVGVHDNFFLLGGHSLQAMQIVSRVREAFFPEFALRGFFDGPTIAASASRIEAMVTVNGPTQSLETIQL